MPEGILVFDGDDTLWFVEPLYDDARQATRGIVAAAGHDGSIWEGLQRGIDVENVATMGTHRERFPTSCAQAYEAVADLDGVKCAAEVIDQIRDAARQVFERPALPNHDALPVLAALHPDYPLALLTKGDPVVQAKRIRDAGVENAFDHVAIVADKTPTEFLNVLQAFGARPQGSWSVGNSLASDVNPALGLGMSAIWIDAHVWEHERRELEAKAGHVVAAASLLQVPEIVRREQQP